MATHVQTRRDTLTNWATNNPVLKDGEIGFVTDGPYFVIGDGISTFNALITANQFFTPPEPNHVLYQFTLQGQLNLPTYGIRFVHPVSGQAGNGAEYNHFATVMEKMKLVKAGLFATALYYQAAPSINNGIRVDLHVNSTDNLLIDNNWLHQNYNNNKVINSLSHVLNEGDGFSLKMTAPPDYDGTQATQNYSYLLDFELM
jgi:major tropism determinant Mtd-like protein